MERLEAVWLEPPEEGPYEGTCGECCRFRPCPCGCGWGTCEYDAGEWLCGDVDGCEDGVPA